MPAAHLAPTEIETIPLPSSEWLSFMEYDPKQLRLEVWFKSGSIVQHWPIYPQTWQDLKVSPSKGSFYYAAIKKTTNPIKIK